MFIKTVTYKDFNGNDRSEELAFNLTKSELRKCELETNEPMSAKLERVYGEKVTSELVKTISEFVHMSYGKRSPDGASFIKKKPDGSLLVDDFEQTAAYDAFMNEMYESDTMLIDFCVGIFPADVQAIIKEEATKNDAQLAAYLNGKSASSDADTSMMALAT